MSSYSRVRVSRRSFGRRLGALAGLGALGSLLAACDAGMSAPAKPTEAPKAAAPAAPPPTTAPAAQAPAAAATTAPAAAAAAPAAAAKPAEATKPAPAAAAPAAAGGSGAVKWFVRSNPLENKWQDDFLVPEYKKRQSKNELTKIVVPGAEFNAKLFALQAAGDTPNIFGFANYSTYWARNLIIPLDDFLQTDKDIAGQHFPGMFDTYRWWGKRWGVPMAPRFGTVTAYNMDLFDKAGVPYPKMDFSLKEWNVDVMLDKATKLTKNFGKPDVVFGINYIPWGPHGLAYLWGGDTYTKAHYDQGIDDHTTVDVQASQDSHQFKLDLIQKHKVHPSSADNQAIQVVGSPFMTGRVAMNVEGGWIWGNFSAIKEFKWGMAPVPGKTTVKNSENLNVWVLGNAPNKEGAWDAVKFMTSQEGERAWVQITGSQPSRPDVLDEWVKKHVEHGMKAEDVRLFVTENIKNTVESMDHMVVDHTRFDDAYNQKSTALWDGKTDVKSFLADLKANWDGTAKEVYLAYKDKLLK